MLQLLQRILQLAINQMGVNLRGGQVRMAQCPLNNQQVVGCLVKVSGERMPQPVRRNLFLDSSLLHPMHDAVGHLPFAEPRLSIGDQ